MNKMLSDALREYHGLREQLDRALLGDKAEKWGAAFRTFMREEPTWAEGMIYQPLEWGSELFNIRKDHIRSIISSMNQATGPGWRVPTQEEIIVALKMGKKGFTFNSFYWVSVYCDGDATFGGVFITSRGLICNMSNRQERGVYLRLVREVKLPA